MPNKNTFAIKPIKELIKNNLVKGTVIDPFANNNIIKDSMTGINYITNDLDEQYNTDYHLDALDFLKLFENSSIDMVLYDPPYSPRQVSECYKALGKTVDFKTTQSSYWTNHKKEISRIVKKRWKGNNIWME